MAHATKVECGRFVRPRKKGQVAVRCKRVALTAVSSHPEPNRGSGSGHCGSATRCVSQCVSMLQDISRLRETCTSAGPSQMTKLRTDTRRSSRNQLTAAFSRASYRGCEKLGTVPSADQISSIKPIISPGAKWAGPHFFTAPCRTRVGPATHGPTIAPGRYLPAGEKGAQRTAQSANSRNEAKAMLYHAISMC